MMNQIVVKLMNIMRKKHVDHEMTSFSPLFGELQEFQPPSSTPQFFCKPSQQSLRFGYPRWRSKLSLQSKLCFACFFYDFDSICPLTS